MARGKEICPQMRSRICELKSYGLSCGKIYQLHPEISLNTIKTTIRREASRLDNVSKPRSGRPHKLSEEERDHIYGLTIDNPHVKMKDLLAEVDHKVKKRSIQYLLREMGRRKWLQLRRPEIQPHHAEQRLRWAKKYKELNWDRVKWSDESTIE
jgi:transposase